MVESRVGVAIGGLRGNRPAGNSSPSWLAALRFTSVEEHPVRPVYADFGVCPPTHLDPPNQMLGLMVGCWDIGAMSQGRSVGRLFERH